MKIISLLSALLLVSVVISSCGNADDPQMIIDKYCALKQKQSEATTSIARAEAIAERKAYEKMIDDKYFKDYETYQKIMEGIKKCDASQVVTADEDTSSEDEQLLAMIPLAVGEVAEVAKAYCILADKSIAAAQNSSDEELKKIMAAKVLFEHNMEESYKDNPARRDSIFKLIRPCLEKEEQFNPNNQ